MVDGPQFARRLLTLKRDAESLEQETGSNYLYLAIGSLVHLKPSGEEARAPLFLLPVTVTGGTFVQFGFQAQEGESAVPNLCLVQWLQSTKGVRLAALENPPTDDNGLAIDTAFTELRRQLAEEKLPFRIDETASLALLKFSTFQIWHDLDENWQTLMRSPIVEHLVERPGETFADPRGDAPVQVDEAAARLPVPADGSQLRAIAMARGAQLRARRTARNGQIADHHQPHRRPAPGRPHRVVRRREASRARGRARAPAQGGARRVHPATAR
jgi:hypothetical protein